MRHGIYGGSGASCPPGGTVWYDAGCAVADEFTAPKLQIVRAEVKPLEIWVGDCDRRGLSRDDQRDQGCTSGKRSDRAF